MFVTKKLQDEKGICILPGNFFGFLSGTNLASSAKAIGGPKMNPLASMPFKGFEAKFEH